MTTVPLWWRRAAGGALAAFVVCLPLSLSGMELALGAMLVLAAVAALGRYCAWRRSALDVPLAAFAGVLVLSTLAGGPSRDALHAYRGLWIVGAYPATMLLLRDEKHAARLACLLVVGTAMVAVYGMVQHFTGIDVYREMMGRRALVKAHSGGAAGFEVIGFFPNTLTYAHSLIIPLGWALAGALGNGEATWRRVVSGASAMLIGMGLVLSTARGAWIAGIVVVGSVCLMTGGLRRLSLAAGVFAIGAVLLVQSAAMRTDALSIFDLEANAARMEIYAANLDLVRDHPILGVGFGNYRRGARPYYDRHPGADRRSHAHNNFLQVAAEAGLVGLGAFCYLFGTVLLRGWLLLGTLRSRRPEVWPTAAGAWLGVVGFLIGGLTQETFADSECALPMWFAVGVLMTLDRMVRADGRRA